MSGYRFTVQMNVVVEVADVDAYAIDEGGLALDDEALALYTLDDVKVGIESALAGFLVNEVNNTAEMPMWMALADATVTEVAEL